MMGSFVGVREGRQGEGGREGLVELFAYNVECVARDETAPWTYTGFRKLKSARDSIGFAGRSQC